MKMGMSVSEAVNEAMADMRDLKDPYAAHINLIVRCVALRDGNHASMHECNNGGYGRPNERSG
jgi:hypothetical protein